MFDKITTYQGGTTDNDKYVRYATEIQFNVILRPYENEQIYVPTVTVIYRERSLSSIKTDHIAASAFIVTFLYFHRACRRTILWT